MACELLEGCIFFNDKMANMPSMADLLKERYCKGDFHACARYRVYAEVGRENVPADLFPAQTDRVASVIASVRA
ncbi:MAG: hypothetical protein Kow0056_15030 [Coriobacteriia bacterium]